jgi:CO/xanthine dehydrogenase FAD-binding subunit
MNEAIAFFKRRPDALPCAGNTRLMADPAYGEKPLALASLSSIHELSLASKSDRFIELGSGTTLAKILKLPDARPLDPLKRAIETIAVATVRNLATIGGNIGSRHSFGSTFPVLSCLDSSCEIRDVQGSRWMSVHRLADEEGKPDIPQAAIITRIRIPIRLWDSICIIRKGDGLLPGVDNYTLCALASFDKGTFTDLRIVAAGAVLIRLREVELGTIGKKYPLSQKDVDTVQHSFLEHAIDKGVSSSLAIALADNVRGFLVNAPEDIL